MAQDWAVRAQTLRSYELLAREVMPAFQNSAVTTQASRNWAAEHRPEFIGQAGAAITAQFERHAQEKR
jgi:limonene 1,2-monooxygenase